MDQTLLIDFDSTLSRREGFDILAEMSLMTLPQDEKKRILQDIQDITHNGMNGTTPFDKSLRSRLDAIQLHPVYVEQTAQYLSLPFNISPSFLAYRDQIAQNADDIFIISGGFREIILPVATFFGIHSKHVFANEFTFDDEGKYGIDWENPLSQEGGKVTVATQLKEAGLLKPTVIAVGDGGTDCQIRDAGVADLFFAFTESAVREHVIPRADLVASSFQDVALHIGWGLPQAIEHANGHRELPYDASMQRRK